jgi:histidinol-phosphate aminotransferase
VISIMDAIKLAVPGVQKLTPYLPGKPISDLQRELGIDHVVKLASNENPLGPSPKALTAIKAALEELHLYPDGSGFALKTALAEKFGLDRNGITLGNGSNDVLELIARAFLGDGLSAVFSEHAFAVYPIVTQAVGANARIAPAHSGEAGPRYGHNLSAMRAAIDSSTRVVFIANPNNPTGTHLCGVELKGFLDQVPQDVLVVIDEAYFEYVHLENYPNALEWLGVYPNLIVTRTFSKAYGLAGLRVGYAVSSPEIADVLNRVRQPFNVNIPALEGALAALQDDDHLKRTIELNDRGLDFLRKALSVRGFEVIPSVGNFLTFDLGQLAAPIYDALLRKGVIVRPIANYGMPRHLRVTIGTDLENQAFLDALDQVTGG